MEAVAGCDEGSRRLLGLDEYTRRQKLALRYADAIMWDPNLADDELWDALRDEFNPEEVVELGYWVGFTYGGQRWIKTLQARQGELDAAIAAAEVPVSG